MLDDRRRSAVEKRAALQRRLAEQRAAEGLAEWWAEHVGAPLRPVALAGVDDAVVAKLPYSAPGAPDRVVRMAEVAGVLAPGAGELVVVFQESGHVFAAAMTAEEFRASAGAVLTAEGGVHAILVPGAEPVLAEHDRDHAPDGRSDGWVALWGV
ncbi:hypothetical protein [Kitasatospora sp. NPDC008115]|uniref:hypothetical protein n=1 Tax=Kitasatospora sp. NPDC008115 TaxID=3364022 RepID=UPI0036EEB431